MTSCTEFESVMRSFLPANYINHSNWPDLFLVLPFLLSLFIPDICIMIKIILLLVNPYLLLSFSFMYYVNNKTKLKILHYLG